MCACLWIWRMLARAISDANICLNHVLQACICGAERGGGQMLMMMASSWSACSLVISRQPQRANELPVLVFDTGTEIWTC